MAGIPVISVRGILESGKTYFIIDSLTRGDFGDLGKVLILSQEEGVEEYNKEELSPLKIYAEYVEKENWKDSVINDLVRKHKPHVIFVERNETWDKKEYSYPEYFDVQQELCVIDGSSFKEYFSAMRQMMVDMVKTSELAIINRCDYTENTSNIKSNYL